MATENKAPAEMTPAKMVFRLLIYVVILGAVLFACAGRWDWAMGWAWLVVHFGVVLTSATVAPIDPELIDERTHIKEGVKEWDKIIVIPTQILMPFGFLRYWSHPR